MESPFIIFIVIIIIIIAIAIAIAIVICTHFHAGLADEKMSAH